MKMLKQSCRTACRCHVRENGSSRLRGGAPGSPGHTINNKNFGASRPR